MFSRLIISFQNSKRSKLYKQKLIKKYKPKITPRVRTHAELIELLKKEFDLTKINADEVEPNFWKYGVMENVSYDGVPNSSLRFQIFRIERNEKSKMLYISAKKEFQVDDDENIIVVFESKTKYMTSNFNRLLCKLFLFEGVSDFDYENETPEFMGYLDLLNDYLENEDNICEEKLFIDLAKD